MRRRAVLLIAVMAAALLLAGGTALAVDKVCTSSCGGTTGADLLIGNDSNNTLSPSSGNDQIIGNGGSDVLNGGPGSDTYTFTDGFGGTNTDPELLEDTAGSTSDRDTVDFSKVTSAMNIAAVPEFVSAEPSYGYATVAGSTINRVTFYGGTTIEKIIGSAGSDSIQGGKQINTYVIGGGSDKITDWGGYGGATGVPALPPSIDTYIYKSGSAQITDFGSSGDVLDLRPLKVTDVSFKPSDGDLVLFVGPTSVITIKQHLDQSNRRIEKLVFADRTITSISVS